MKKPEEHEIGRIAFRVEDRMWNAYYALPHTLENAQLIGSIAMAAVEANDELRIRFMSMMRDTVSVVIQDITGQWPSWTTEPKPAPQHERKDR